MTVYQVEKHIQSRPEEVWQLLTTFEDISWRSTITSVSVEGKQYSELHQSTGYASTYHIREKEENRYLELSIEHIDGRGKRQIYVKDLENGSTLVTITEEFHSHIRWLQPLIRRFFKKELGIYLEDLEQKAKGA